MEKCRVSVACRGAKKRDGDRVTRRKASPSYSTPLVRSLACTKAEDVLCCQGAACSAEQ
jgi:hypothetical protein